MCKLLTDGQPETDTGLALAPWLSLLEGRKDAGGILRRDADAGVAHPSAQFDALAAERNRLHGQGHAPGRRELDGITKQVEQDLPQALAVRIHLRRNIAGCLEDELQSFPLGVYAHHRRNFLDQGWQGHGRQVQIETAGPDPRKIQQIVDEIEQMPATARYRRQCLLATGVRQRTLAHKFGISEDRMQRRAQLVANVCEELVLGTAGRFELRARGHQRPSLRAEQADIQHAGYEDDGEHRQRCPDGPVIDLAFIPDRQPFLRNCPLFLVADRVQHLVEDVDQLGPVIAHTHREALRLKGLLDRRRDLQVANLALPNVEHDGKDVVYQAVHFSCGHRHQALEDVRVGRYRPIRICPQHQGLGRVSLHDGDAFGREIAQSGYETVVVTGDDDVYVVQIGFGEGEKGLAFLRARDR